MESPWGMPDTQQYMYTSGPYDTVYAFPRPQPHRVVKPRSAGSSPSAAGRRRMTMSHLATMYQQQQQQHHHHHHLSTLDRASNNNAYGTALLDNAGRPMPSRPISWHPASMQQMAGRPVSSGITTPASEEFIMMGFPANAGFFQQHMGSYPMSGVSASSQQQNLFPSVADSQAGLYIQQQQHQHYHHPTVSPLNVSQAEQSNIPWDAGVPDTSFLMSRPVSDGWSFDALSIKDNDAMQSNYVADSCYESITSSDEDAGPPTPNFLPIQQFDDLPAASKSESELMSGGLLRNGDELVGMGLYSEPEEVIIEHPAYGRMTGKGLKLEETFTPSSGNEDGEGDEEDEDGDAEGDELETADEATNDLTASTTIYDSMATSPSFGLLGLSSDDMSQKSFLFDADDFECATRSMAACQPAAVGRSAGVGYAYGWI